MHSPSWWKGHFDRTGKYDQIVSEEHRDGVRFWPDRVHRLVEEQGIEEMREGTKQMVAAMLKMIANNDDGYVTHFILSARRVPSPKRLPWQFPGVTREQVEAVLDHAQYSLVNA